MMGDRQDKLRKRAEHANKERDAILQDQSKKTNTRKIALFAGIGVLVVLVGAFTVHSLSQPGYWDGFAKCLNEKGAVMYGASFCPYSKEQRGMFGSSVKFINYKEYTEGKGITRTPTWIINGERYENVQSFERLSALTGCSLS